MTKRVEFELPRSARIGGTDAAPMWNASRCKTCGFSVVWIETPAGKRMPLSLKTARHDAETNTWRAESHFSDCAHADAHRKR